MIQRIRIFSFALAIAIITCLVVAFAMGVEGLSSFFGVDVEHISFTRQHTLYEFSLIERLPIILTVAFILVSFCVIAGLKAKQAKDIILGSISFLREYMRTTIGMIARSDVKYFLILSLITNLFLAYSFPLTLDEPITYYDFVKGPAWEAIALYPYPNNHVLMSLLANISNELGFVDLLFRLRLPTIIVSFFTWIFAYRFARKYYSDHLAIAIVAIGTVVASTLQYGYIARGYAFVLFFVVIGLYAAYNIIEHKNRKRDWLIFALSSALGAWAMPSYLYPFLSISLFIFVFNIKHIKTQIIYSLLTGILVFLLYSPILVFSGIESLTSNEFVETVDRGKVLAGLSDFAKGTLTYMFCVPAYITVLVLLVAFLRALYKKDKKTLVLWSIFLITPFLFLVIHSVLTFFRTFFYYGFVFVFLLAASFSVELSKQKRYTILTLGLIAHLALLTLFFKNTKTLMFDAALSQELRSEILEDNKSYYIHNGISWLEIINLEFEAERYNYTISIETGNVVDAEKVGNYDYVLIRKEQDQTKKHEPYKEMKAVFSTPVNIYKSGIK